MEQPLYTRAHAIQTRWASFENPSAGKGCAAKDNRGAKGHAFESLATGETKVLLDVEGSGVVRRIWMTVSSREPKPLRALRLEMYWDGATTPAVSCPLTDFFGTGLGRIVPFECALFSDPEGRSFNCFVPMPFRRRARITLTNDAAEPVTHLFYDVNLQLGVPHADDALYFHGHWRRESPNRLGHDFDILPRVRGAGRFLGCNLGVIANPAYNQAWWGEGEVKMWLDGDGEHPTLCGTGTEDYIGTAWGQGCFAHRSQGCILADHTNQQWSFYRHHLDDPVFFDTECRVAIQTIGGCDKPMAAKLLKRGVPLQPITLDANGKIMRLLERAGPVDLADPALPPGWCNFFRQDDWSATAYFYLDRPENGLPPLPPVQERTRGLLEKNEGSKRADAA